ncbi:stationary phase survival protein SurE [Desertivirga xinjiangensis]|uniref:stationary phase survival protein SurE n=1 Tax=Desertivirga xinjiangensis TaxID=539206 RepID=UPI00210AB058|nr:stationary phase survival protein SurE [Pedobacter xinjiangensis]
MLNKDNVWFGTALGLILPAIAFIIVEVLKKNIAVLKSADLLYIGCVALNLFIVKYYSKRYMESTARGIIGSTFICAFIFFYYKMQV